MKKYDNFIAHLKVLERAYQEDFENEFIVSGVIDKFFIQFELSWKLLKEFMRYEGKSIAATGSPREIIKAAYACYGFMDENIWLSMLKSRNDMAHIYDGEKAEALLHRILEEYIPEFQRMRYGIEAVYGSLEMFHR